MSGGSFYYYKKQTKILSRDNNSLREEVKDLKTSIELLRVQYGIEPHFIIEDSDEDN
jgi:hypothetical protein